MKSNQRITTLVAIMTIVALIVVIAAIFTLYLAAIDAERARLIGIAQSQARLLEAVARFDEIHSHEDNPEGAHMATFSQLQDALEDYPGVGETGEFVIAKLNGDQLQFLLRQRNTPINGPLSIPLDSQLAEPMRRALSGETGTIIGLDYDGVRVLAAFEPVSVLDFGLVAKIDMAEIYAPFVRAAAISLGIAMGIIALGVFIFFRFSDPLVQQLEQSHEVLEELVEERTTELEKERAQYRDLYVDAPIAYFSVDKDGMIIRVNDFGCEMFSAESSELVGTRVFDLYADTDAGKKRAQQVFQQFMAGGEIQNQELQYQRLDGETFWGSLTVRALLDKSGNTVMSRSTVVDITDRVQAQHKLQELNQELEARIADRTNELTELSNRLKLATRSANVGIWDWNVVDNVLDWDDTMYKIYGVKREDFSGAYDAWVNGLHPDDVESGQREVEAALEGTKEFDTEFRVIWPDGTLRHVHGMAAVQRIKDGTPVRMIGVNWDVSEQKYREQKIRESEESIRAIVSSAVDGILSVDEHGVIHRYNPAAEQIFGYAPEEVMGKNIKMLMPEPYHSEHEGYLNAYHNTGEKKIIGIGREVEGERKSGQKFPMDLAVSEYWIGKKRMYTGVIRDITDRKQAEKELHDAKETAEASNRTKSEFLASMSHELRTPMNAIIGFSELLQQKTFGELNIKQDRYIGNIVSSGKHLLNLINDILDISKVEAGRLDLNLEKMEIDAAIKGVLTVVKPLSDKKSINIESQIASDMPPLIADPSKFKQMLYNLISNAIKFTPDKGEVSVQSSITSVQSAVDSNQYALPTEHNLLPTDHCLLITVTDSGIGIKAEDLERVFGEFEQVDSSYARQQQGTGLGLTLTRKLAQLHGGWVWAESEGTNTGSTFSLILPLDGPEGAVVDDDKSDEIPAQKPGQSLVLIIEDDPMARELLSQYLSEADYAILRASDRQGGLKMSRQHKPDVITLDIMLPEAEDGWGLLADLKSDDDTKDIPVVVVSITEDQQRGFAMGAVEWFVKPIQRTSLITAIEQLTESGEKLNILIVDDDPTVVELLQDILESQGHGILSALGGQQGIELALAEKPDVIILDLMMPEVSGFEVVRQLRAQEATAQIPILINTAKELSSAERQDLNRHVQSIAPKSKFGQKELLRALTRVIKD